MILLVSKIFGDPDAADVVFTSGADVLAVGINVTHQVILTGNSGVCKILCFKGHLLSTLCCSNSVLDTLLDEGNYSGMSY